MTKVPEGERERWDNPPAFVIGAAKPPENQPKDIQRLVVELEGWVDLDSRLEKLLREKYEVNPARVSRLVESVIEKARDGKLNSPGGLLVKRLREMP